MSRRNLAWPASTWPVAASSLPCLGQKSVPASAADLRWIPEEDEMYVQRFVFRPKEGLASQAVAVLRRFPSREITGCSRRIVTPIYGAPIGSKIVLDETFESFDERERAHPSI